MPCGMYVKRADVLMHWIKFCYILQSITGKNNWQNWIKGKKKKGIYMFEKTQILKFLQTLAWFAAFDLWGSFQLWMLNMKSYVSLVLLYCNLYRKLYFLQQAIFKWFNLTWALSKWIRTSEYKKEVLLASFIQKGWRVTNIIACCNYYFLWT